MSFGFTRKTSLKTLQPVNEDFLTRVTTDIRNDYDMMYTHTISQNAFCLQPKFRFSFQRNAFWPEVKGELSQQNSPTVIQISCHPVKFIYYFLTFYFSFAVLMEAVCIVAFFTDGLEDGISLIIPLLLCVFAYLLTSIGSAICFKRIIKIMEKHCSA